MTSMGIRTLVACAAIAAAALSGTPAWAAADKATADRATPKEAEAMVKKGIAFIKANGKEKGYAEITNKKGQFVDRDLYLMVVQVDGKMLAHGSIEKLVGLNRIDIKDVDGKEMIREMITATQAKGSSWTEYKYSNPVTKKIEAKSGYCERLDDTAIVCGGAYHP